MFLSLKRPLAPDVSKVIKRKLFIFFVFFFLSFFLSFFFFQSLALCWVKQWLPHQHRHACTYSGYSAFWTTNDAILLSIRYAFVHIRILAHKTLHPLRVWGVANTWALNMSYYCNCHPIWLFTLRFVKSHPILFLYFFIPSCSFTFERVIPTLFKFLLKLFWFTCFRYFFDHL